MKDCPFPSSRPPMQLVKKKSHPLSLQRILPTLVTFFFFFWVRGEGGSQHGCLHINSGRNNKSVSFTFTRTPRWAELQFFFVSGFVGCCVGQENRNGCGSFCRCLEWGTTGLVDELAGSLVSCSGRWLCWSVGWPVGNGKERANFLCFSSPYSVPPP